VEEGGGDPLVPGYFRSYKPSERLNRTWRAAAADFNPPDGLVAVQA
jgi:hypothetical protein